MAPILLRPEISAMDLLCEHDQKLKIIVECFTNLTLALMSFSLLKEPEERLSLIADYTRIAIGRLGKVAPDVIAGFRGELVKVLDAASKHSPAAGDGDTGSDRRE